MFHIFLQRDNQVLYVHTERKLLFYKIKQKDCLAQAEQCLCRREKSPDASEEMKVITSWEGYAA